MVFSQNQREEVRDLNDVAGALNAEQGMHHQTFVLEGNGSRESHRGDGYKESDVMYTLNTVEQHAVCYRGDAITNPINASNPQLDDPCHTLTNDSRNYVVIENHPNDSRVIIREDDTFQALTGRMGTGGGNVPLVMETYQNTTENLCASGYDKLGTQEAMNDMYVVQSCNWDGGQISPTLTANNANGAQRMPDKDNFNAVITYGVDSYNQSAECEVQQTLRTNGGGDNSPKICTYKKKNNAGEYDDGVGTLKACGGDYGGGSETLVTTYQDVTGTICEAISKGTSNQIATEDQLVTPNSIVRRLTPLECERLQGFDDNWTNIGEWIDNKGKKHKPADSNRYKALGNSIALPFWQWLSNRIVTQLKVDGVENPTMASLFSGIGGFELVFSRSGCEPIWSSEVEDFCIAVTNRRFGND